MAFYQLKHEEQNKATGQASPESDKARLEAYLAQQEGPPKEH